MSPASRVPEPVRSRWSEPFWEALSRGEFLLQRCSSCGAFQGYPKPVCRSCAGNDLTWTASTGRGTVYTHTTVVTNPPSPFLDQLPYSLVIVELDEGVRYLARFSGDAEPTCGQRVRCVRPDGVLVPTFAAA